MPSKHVVRLTDDHRDRLDRITRIGSAHARTIAHARALLLTDASDGGPAWTDEKAADALGVSPYTVARARKRFVTEGWVAARNAAGATVEWQFTTEDARVKLRQLYPSL